MFDLGYHDKLALLSSETILRTVLYCLLYHRKKHFFLLTALAHAVISIPRHHGLHFDAVEPEGPHERKPTSSAAPTTTLVRYAAVP